MVNKQKQINELAQEVCKGGCCSLVDWEDCEKRDGSCPYPQRIAKHLYKIGYRKQITEV